MQTDFGRIKSVEKRMPVGQFTTEREINWYRKFLQWRQIVFENTKLSSKTFSNIQQDYWKGFVEEQYAHRQKYP